MAPDLLTPRVIASLVLTFCLAGCKVGPDYVEPEVPVDASFINAPPQATTQPDQDATISDWWTVFNDPTLTNLVEQAIAHNHDLRIAAANVRQARELLVEARYQLYPIVPARAGFAH